MFFWADDHNRKVLQSIDFKLTFIKKKEVCILNFDFGLKKWNVCDGMGKQIKMFDLSSDDMLRLANMLFPENELYKNLINTDKRWKS